jgi:hypothetical protein
MVELKPQFADPAGDFASAWNDYRRCRRWYFGIGLGSVAVIAIVGTLLDKASIRDPILWVLVPIWVIAFLIAGIRVCRFKCPRCAQPFFATGCRAHLLARCCLHCGLRKWAKNDSSEENV